MDKEEWGRADALSWKRSHCRQCLGPFREEKGTAPTEGTTEHDREQKDPTSRSRSISEHTSDQRPEARAQVC